MLTRACLPPSNRAARRDMAILASIAVVDGFVVLMCARHSPRILVAYSATFSSPTSVGVIASRPPSIGRPRMHSIAPAHLITCIAEGQVDANMTCRVLSLRGCSTLLCTKHTVCAPENRPAFAGQRLDSFI
jgi:hypothetical protein